MMKKSLFLFLFLFLAISLNSQAKYEPGFYVDNSGKKVEGLVYNRDWRNNPREVSFKIDKNGITKKVNLQNAVSFGIDDFSVFERHVVDFDMSEDGRNSLSEQRKPLFKKDTLFLKVLVDGEDLSLLKYESGMYVRFFYLEKDSIAKPLIYKRYLKTPYRIAFNVDYQQQILNLYETSASVSDRFASLEYTEKYLVGAFKEIIDKRAGTYVNYSSSRVHLKPKVSIVAGSRYMNSGVSNSSTNFEGRTPLVFTYLFGAELEVVLPFWKNVNSVYFGGHFHSLDIEKQMKYSSELISEAQGTAKILYNTVELNFGFRRRFFISGKPRVYSFAALAINVPIDQKMILPDGVELLLNRTVNLNLGVGYFVSPQVNIDLMYSTRKNYLSRYSFYSANHQGLGLLLRYTF